MMNDSTIRCEGISLLYPSCHESMGSMNLVSLPFLIATLRALILTALHFFCLPDDCANSFLSIIHRRRHNSKRWPKPICYSFSYISLLPCLCCLEKICRSNQEDEGDWEDSEESDIVTHMQNMDTEIAVCTDYRGAQNGLPNIQFSSTQAEPCTVQSKMEKGQQNFPRIPTVWCSKLVICPSSCAEIEFG